MKKHRPTLSVSAAAYRAMRDYADAHGTSVSAIVERACSLVPHGETREDVLVIPLARPRIGRPPRSPGPADTSILEGLSAFAAIEVSPELREDVRAQAIREGRNDLSVVLDRGITRMLDALDRSYTGTCVLCGAARDDLKRRRLGPDEEPVPICIRCDEEHPRSGRYAFSGGHESDAVGGFARPLGEGGRRKASHP